MIDKLSESWKVYNNSMKHKRKQISLEDVIIHISIEEQNRKRGIGDKAEEIISKANVVESNTIKPRFRNEQHVDKSNKTNNNKKFKNYNLPFKKKGNYFVESLDIMLLHVMKDTRRLRRILLRPTWLKEKVLLLLLWFLK